MNSAILKFLSVSKNAFPAFLLSPFVLSPPTYHSGDDAYAAVVWDVGYYQLGLVDAIPFIILEMVIV